MEKMGKPWEMIGKHGQKMEKLQSICKNGEKHETIGKLLENMGNYWKT